MKAWFDRQDVKSTGPDGKEKIVSGVLFFHMRKDAVGSGTAPGFEYDQPATPEHIAKNKAEWKAFLDAEWKELQDLRELAKKVVDAAPSDAAPAA